MGFRASAQLQPYGILIILILANNAYIEIINNALIKNNRVPYCEVVFSMLDTKKVKRQRPYKRPLSM